MECDSNLRSLPSSYNEEENREAMLKKVIKDIFLSCDEDCAGLVKSSKLIEYITPFLCENSNALVELKQSLHLDESDPSIDIDTFYNSMDDWTKKIAAIPDVAANDSTTLDENNLSLIKFGHHLLKNYVEANIVNVSSCSSNSLTDTTTLRDKEVAVLKEHVQALQHQNKNIAEELNVVKLELINSFELNENLQADLRKCSIILRREQKLNEELRAERKHEEDSEQELANTRRQAILFERRVSTIEKQNNQLEIELNEMRSENQMLEDKIAHLIKKDNDTLKKMVELETEIELRKHETLVSQERNEKLKNKNESLHDIVEQRNCELDKLRVEKATLEKYLKECVQKSDSQSFGNRRSNSFSEYSHITKSVLKHMHVTQNLGHTENVDSPSTELRKCHQNFYSPLFLKILENPVTPLGDSPITFSKNLVRYQSLENAEVRTSTPTSDDFSQKIKPKLTRPVDVTKNLSATSLKVLKDTNTDALSTLSSEDTFSPPTLYVIDRTGISLKGSDSGEDLALKLHYMSTNTQNIASLHEEISKATLEELCAVEHESEDLKCLESEKKVFNLQHQLMEHQNCTFIIEKQTDELRSLATENSNYISTISTLTAQLQDVKTQLLSSVDNENLLFESYRCLEEFLKSSKSYIAEVKMKLNKCVDFESFCKDLQTRIKELKTENTNKYVKLAESDIDIGTWENGGVNDSKSNENEEKYFEDRLRTLEQEKYELTEELEALLVKIMTFEKERKNWKHEKVYLQLEKQNLHEEVENLRQEDESLCSQNFTVQDNIPTIEDNSKVSILENGVNNKQDYECLTNQYQELTKRLQVEKQELVNQMSDLNLQINSLRMDLNVNVSMKQRQQVELERLQSEIEISRKHKEAFESEIYKLKKDLNCRRTENREINYNLEKAKKEMDTLQKDKYNLEKELEKMIQKVLDYEGLRQRCGEMSQTLENTKKEYDVMKVTHDICDQNRKELQFTTVKDFTNLKIEMDKVIEEKLNLERENVQLSSKIECLDNQIFELHEKMSLYSIEEDENDEENQGLCSKLEKNDVNLKTLDIDNRRLKNEKVESDAIIATLTTTNGQLRLTNEECHNQLQNQRHDISQLQAENEMLKRTVQQQEKEKTKLGKEIEKLGNISEQFEDAQRSIQENKGVIIAQQEEAILQKELCECFQNKIEEIQNLLGRKEDALKNLAIEIGQKEETICKQQYDILNKEMEINEFKTKIQHITILKDKKEADEKHIEELNKRIKELVRQEQYISDKFSQLVKLFVEDESNEDEDKDVLIIIETEIQNLKANDKSNISTIKFLKEQMALLEVESKTLKETSGHSNEQLVALLEEKSKLTIKINMLMEQHEALVENSKIVEERKGHELQKYILENEKLKIEMSSLMADKELGLQRLKCIEQENQFTKAELEQLLLEKDTWLSQKIYTRKRESLSDCCKTFKSSDKLNPRSNFERLNIRKERLEEKLSHLEEQLMQEKESLSHTLSKKIDLEKEIEILKFDNLRLSTELANLKKTLQPSKSLITAPRMTEMGDSASQDVGKKEDILELQMKLETSKTELASMKNKLETEEKLKEDVIEQVETLRERIEEKRVSLEGITARTARTLEVPDNLLRQRNFHDTRSIFCPKIFASLEREILRIGNQIVVTINVLDYLITKKQMMSFSDFTTHTEDSQQKTDRLPKFTLKPPTLILRSTPDKSLDGWNGAGVLNCVSTGGAGKSQDLGVRLSLRGLDTEKNLKPNDFFDQDASLTLDENALEGMGLLGAGTCLTNLSDVEMEQKFNQIVLAFEMDSVSLKRRLSLQHVQFKELEEQIAQIKCCRKAKEKDLHGKLLETVCTHLEAIVEQYVQTSLSTTLHRSFKLEMRMINCFGLIVNYAMHLQKRLEDRNGQLLQSTENDYTCTQPELNDQNIEMSISTQDKWLERVSIAQHVTSRSTSRVKYVIIFLTIWFILMVLYALFLFLIVAEEDGNMYCFPLPFGWKPFDVNWPPIATKKYINGPPPV